MSASTHLQVSDLLTLEQYHRDRAEFRAGIRLTREIAAQPAFDFCRGPEVSPGPEVQSDAEIDAYVRANANSAYHPCGSCKMGVDDLAVVEHICDTIAVMYLGKLCEIAAAEDLYQSPKHPYSALLLASIPEPDPEQKKPNNDIIESEMPSPIDPPPGCRFHTRCPNVQDVCTKVEPELIGSTNNGRVACHFPL